MPSREERLTIKLMEVAERSNMFNRHGAVLVKGGKIYACGSNSTRGCINGNAVTSIHAEIDAIRTSLKLGIIPSGDIWVIQYKRSGIIGLSKPCGNCLKMIKRYNISRIYYSTLDGGITMVKTADASSDWMSGAQKVFGANRITL